MTAAVDIVECHVWNRKESYCKEMGKQDTFAQLWPLRKLTTPIKEGSNYPEKSDSLVQNSPDFWI